MTTGLGRSPLWIAAFKNHPEVVRFLAENGADVDQKSDDRFYHTTGWSPLHAASRKGCLECYRLGNCTPDSSLR